MQVQNNQKQYSTDKRLVYSCQYHVIFCPKYRRSVLKNGIDVRAKELILSKQLEYGYSILDMEIMPDHVHLLIDTNPKIGIYPIVSKIKGLLSHELREEFPQLKSKLPCLWTNSNFISSVGFVNLDTIKEYISNQKNQ
jgi:putative transposase